jgi:hypothetical protein
VHSAGRVETTTPLQKLFVLNSPFMIRQAQALVERLDREAGTSPHARIDRAYQLLYGRSASDDELQLGLGYVGDEESQGGRWTQYAHALLGANELLMVD